MMQIATMPAVTFPYASIKPLHKNEDRCEISNYRPVSLLTSFQKYLKW